MNKSTVVLSFIIFPLLAFSQDKVNGKVIELHSAVGYIITVDEKVHFNLFSEYKDSIFQSAMLVLHPDSSYAFLIKSKTFIDKSFERETNKQEIDEMRLAIEKKIDKELFYVDENKIEIHNKKLKEMRDASPIYYSDGKQRELSLNQKRDLAEIAIFALRVMVYVAINFPSSSGSATYSTDKPSGNTVYAPRGKNSKTKGKRK